jgi:hypothetical protein
LAAEQDRGVDASPADVYADSSEGIAGSLADEEDVSDASGFGIVFCEEAGSGAGGIEEGCLRGGDS